MKQAQALELLKTGRNVFITGAAGSGKTHLVNSYIAYLRERGVDMGITASTGIAATHMGGVTIHSWSGMGVHAFLSEYDIEGMREKPYLAKRFERVKVLIIDEVSMLHHFRLDLVDQILRTMKKVDDPFGGVQVVLCGDFFQLPPVSRFGEPPSLFVYHSDAWKNGDFCICYLDEQFRQHDPEAVGLLNEIRSGEVSAKTHKLLEKHSHPHKKVLVTEPTRLYTHNEDVDTINERELAKLVEAASAEYVMEEKGKPFIVEALKKSCLAQPALKLKVGARVMCIKNNFEEGYVNGTLGVVVSCSFNEDPVVRLSSGKRVTIGRASWKIEEDGHTKAELLQYPLRLAWAITVHKSQGMSLDAAEMDLSKSFEPGMGYVALSRVRSLAGLRILGLNARALEVNPEVLEFDEQLREASVRAEEKLRSLSPAQLAAEQKDFMEYCVPERAAGKKAQKIPTHELTAALIEQKKSLTEMARERGLTTETIVDHIEKLIEEEYDVDLAYLKKDISRTHWLKIDKAFAQMLADENCDGIFLAPAKKKLGANISYVEIRLARALKGLVPKQKKT